MSAACPAGAALYSQVLALSLGLATLSVLLGFVLVSIPTGGATRRLRSAGYVMIMDGAVYLVFMTIISSIGLFMSLALSMLSPGASTADPVTTVLAMYAGYDRMFSPNATFRLTLTRIYAAVENYLNAYAWIPLIGAAQARMYWSLINPTLQLLNAAAVVTTSLFFLGEFIRCAWLSLVALGAFIYGLPGRIGRPLGAALIATMLVFFVGLPFMPIFVGTADQPGLLQLPDLQSNANMTQFYLKDSARLLLAAGQANAQYESYNSANVRFDVEPGYLPGGGQLEGGYTSNYLIQLTNGALVWKLWTDVDGTRVYRLPAGNYRISSITFIGQSLPFQGGESFRVEDTSNTTVPIRLFVYGVRAALEGREVEGYVDLKQTTTQLLSISRDVTGVRYTVQVNVRSESDQLVAYYDTRADMKFLWEEPCTPAGTTVSCGLGPCEGFAGISDVGNGARRWSLPMRVDRHWECPCGNCTLCETCMASLPQVHTLTIVTNWIIPLVELPATSSCPAGMPVCPKTLVDVDPVLGPQLAYFQDLSNQGISSLRELADYAAKLAIQMIFAPLLYVLILGLVAIGIARALGGGGGLPLPGLG